MKINKLLLTLFLTLGLIPTNAYADTGTDKIHFIATGSSDAILIESNGKFGLVDAAEDTGTSRTRAPQSEIDEIKNLKGYEDVVVKYLKDQGVEKLDFVIATHAHSDHIGGMDTVLSNFKVDRVYTREYKETYKDGNGKTQQLFVGKYEYTWDNQEVYNDMIRAAKKAQSNIIYIDGNSTNKALNFALGDFKIQIVNNRLYNSPQAEKNILISSENSNSLGVVVSKNDKKAFLAGDIENSSIDNDEKFLISNTETKDILKNIDLLKMPHHGANGSEEFINYLNPGKVVVTGFITYDNFSYKKFPSKENVYTTGDNNTVVVEFTDGNYLKVSGKSNSESNKNWIKNTNGTWSYVDNYGKKAIGWNELSWNGKVDWYYFNSKGEMVTGWQKVSWNGKLDWYYFNSSGEMVTGWQKLKWNNTEKWYYFCEKTDSTNYKGAMLTGWQQIKWNGKLNWYYFNSSGEMLTGTHKLYWNGVASWYTFNSDGSLR